MTDQPQAPPPAPEPEPDPDQPDTEPDDDQAQPTPRPAVIRHEPTQPPTEGGIWTAPALSEQPGHVKPAPDGWENPPAVERHGSSQPPEQPIWTPSHGGTGGPYELGRTEETAPEGYENPPARQSHGAGPGA